jgi:hypothetical protein
MTPANPATSGYAIYAANPWLPNGYYWIKHDLYTIDSRNLGYYSELQNELINIFRSLIIDWLNVPDNVILLLDLDKKSKNILNNKILFMEDTSNKKLIINQYIIFLMEKNTENNMGLFELFILNKIQKIPIVIMINNVQKYVIDNNIKLLADVNLDLNSKVIYINLDISDTQHYPINVDVIYYKK